MSLPLGVISPEPVPAVFMPPLDEPYLPLEEAVLGGTAIGAGAEGRAVQRWTVFYEGGSLKVAPESGAVEYTLPVVDEVLTCSLGFDSNMQVAIAYQTASGSHLYFFDSVGGVFTTMNIVGATSCRASTDDPRLFNSTNSDVIFSYVLDEVLYYRQQRDRYLTEYTVGPAQGELLRAGPNALNRFQWKLGTYVPPT